MNQTLGILFYLVKTKERSDGTRPIYMRITVDGKRVDVSLHRAIHPDNWNAEAGKPTGKKEEAREIALLIDSYTAKVHEYQRRQFDRNEMITATSLKNALLRISEKKTTLVELFTHHNTQLEKLHGPDSTKGTFKKYKTTLGHVKEFLSEKYHTDDMFLTQLDNKFIADFDYHLRTEKKCNNNTTVKYVANLRKVLRIALDNDWLDKDPFKKYRASYEAVDREFLTEEELKIIENKSLKVTRLSQVRDVFVFSCYTGLAYADVSKLRPDQITIAINKEKWIETNRTKTKTQSNIPLLPKAREIIEKYKDHPGSKVRGTIFPLPSNQKTNAYLKEIADLCEIEKNLTFHIARHTFATTVTLTNGVPIETVSSMLGHKSFKTTQIYAKVIKKKVSRDMNALKVKLDKSDKGHPKKQRQNAQS
jgi:site-specific recombinase XerD